MSSLSKLNLGDDFAEAQLTEDASRWNLERKGDLEVWATVYPIHRPNELFTARLTWLTYPGDLPASVTFVEPVTGRLGIATAWPKAAGFRPPTDICATWTAEGYIAHPEWKPDPSKRLRINGNALLLVLRILVHELDSSFEGRNS